VFDRATLGAALAHGPVVRVVVADVHGSAPREVGAAMLVWADGQSGTIGGGALEWEAVRRARALLSRGHSEMQIDRLPLGPALGQCCGGAVTLVSTVWTTVPDGPVVARGPGAMPLAVARILDRARARGLLPETQVVERWLVEGVAQPRRTLWVWGAGHVGRAIVDVMAPLPDVGIVWLDVAADRFPMASVHGVTQLAHTDLAGAVAGAPRDAHHLILTFSHALDLELCHRLLHHGFASAGLIGSATKAARFRSRLAALGHMSAHIARIRCPIGDPSLGKHPHAIAVGVAAEFLAGDAVRNLDHKAAEGGAWG
jgi:xanthine dehydrogenase accessory factor